MTLQSVTLALGKVAAITASCFAAEADFRKVEICDILREPSQYAGTNVEVEGEIKIGKEQFALAPLQPCPNLGRTMAEGWPELLWIAMPNQAAFALPTEWRYSGGLMTAMGPVHTRALISGLKTGLFGVLRGRLEARREYLRVSLPNGSSVLYGFGHLNAHVAQIVLGGYLRLRLEVVGKADDATVP